MPRVGDAPSLDDFAVLIDAYAWAERHGVSYEPAYEDTRALVGMVREILVAQTSPGAALPLDLEHRDDPVAWLGDRLAEHRVDPTAEVAGLLGTADPRVVDLVFCDGHCPGSCDSPEDHR